MQHGIWLLWRVSIALQVPDIPSVLYYTILYYTILYYTILYPHERLPRSRCVGVGVGVRDDKHRISSWFSVENKNLSQRDTVLVIKHRKSPSRPCSYIQLYYVASIQLCKQLFTRRKTAEMLPFTGKCSR